MLVALYIIGICAAFVAVGQRVKTCGTRPGVGRLRLGLLGGLAFAALLSFAMPLDYEGVKSRLPLWLWLCAAMLLCSVRPDKRAVIDSIGVFVWFIALQVYHLGIARSAAYTDNPGGRLRMIAYQNVSSAKCGGPQRPIPAVRAAAHTWLTGLYRVLPRETGNSAR